MEPVYLGVEIKTREFESRLRTAAHLLKMGIPVVIGQQWSIWENVQTLPRGVALFKTTNEIQAKVMRAFKSAGHTVAALDEEALCCRGAACFLQGMADAAAPNIDLFLAQNKEQQAVLNSKYKNLNIRVVGNPRVDFNQERLAEKQSAAAEIQKKHGEFILFNTNFGCINSVWPDKALKKIAIAAGQDMTTWDARLNWERRHKQEFELLLDWAIANSQSATDISPALPFSIVLRVHPGERADYWRARYGNAVSIIENTEPIAWLLAARVMVHCRCTTGLEAAVVGAKSINLEPIEHPTENAILNSVNLTVKSWLDAAEALIGYVDGLGPIQSYDSGAALAAHFPSGDSAASIASELAALVNNDSSPFSFSRFAPAAVRPEILQEKCTIDPAEFTSRLTATCLDAGIRKAPRAARLDDSLFFAMP
tara:strand:+ start:219 stop:1490 length:1272 start_codon:yes stop_codon:yes gene_type:complete